MKPFLTRLLPVIESGHIPVLRRFAVPVVSVCAAVLLRYWLSSYTTPSPLIFFPAAILVAAAYGSFWSGLFATVLSVFSITYFMLLPTASPLEVEQETIVLTLFIFQGVGISVIATLMHRAYRELGQRNIELESERRQKDDFIGMASHELKSPVTSLSAFAQILQRRLEPQHNQELDYLADKFLSQTRRVSDLVNDLLEFSRLGLERLILEPIEFDLGQLAAEIVENLQATTTTHTIVIMASREIRVVADRDRIGQVITNFLTNAIKYSPAGEQILVRLEDNPQDIALSVQDFGIGIKPEHQNRIFEQFFRVYDTKQKAYPGLGVGLYICAEIIRKHDGRIWFESRPEDGTTFYFAIPRMQG